MRNLYFTLLATAALLVPAQADWVKMDGQSVPGISAKSWLNTAKGETPTPKTLKGKVYLLEFFTTT